MVLIEARKPALVFANELEPKGIDTVAENLGIDRTKFTGYGLLRSAVAHVAGHCQVKPMMMQ